MGKRANLWPFFSLFLAFFPFSACVPPVNMLWLLRYTNVSLHEGVHVPWQMGVWHVSHRV